jgi:hypothetical protein
MGNSPLRPSKRDVAIALAILTVGVAAMLIYHAGRTNGEFSKLLYNDERTYYLPAAEAIRADGFSWFFTERSLWTGPLNPLWVTMWGERVALVKLANVALFVLAGLAVWDLARRFFGSRAALIATAAYATYPPLYRFTPTILTEPLFVSLTVIALWIASLHGHFKERAVAIGGVALGFATLARPTLQLYPLFLLAVYGVWRLWAKRKHTAVLVSTREVLMFVAGFALVVIPYAAKNLVSLEKAGLANGAGAVLYLGNDLRTHGYEPVDVQLRFNTKEISAPYTHLDTEGDRRLLSAGLDLIKENPVEIALLQPSKALRLVFGSPEHYFRPNTDAIEFFRERSWVARLNLWDLVATPILALLGLLGLITLRVNPLMRLLIGSLVAYLILLNTALFPIPRMVLAAFPFLMVFAGGALTSLPRRIWGTALAAGVCIVLFIGLKGLVATPGLVSERYAGYFDPIARVTMVDQIGTNDLIETSDSTVMSIGPDPFVILDVADFEASLNQVMFITMRTDQTVMNDELRAQVFWRTDESGFSEERSAFFDLYRDDEPLTYAVSPSFRHPWSGTISELRLDFPDFEHQAEYGLESIEIRK